MISSIPWGETIKGSVELECTRCGHKWTYHLEEGGEVICEIIGLLCPNCNKISGHRVLGWSGLNTLKTWFR